MSPRKAYSPEIKFDDLSDDAMIQMRRLQSYQVVPGSPTTIWRRCNANEFPKPIKVSKGITAWRVGDIRKYLRDLSSKKNGK